MIDGMPLMKAEDGIGASETRSERQLSAPTRPLGAPFHDIGEAVTAKRSPLANRAIFSLNQPGRGVLLGESQMKQLFTTLVILAGLLGSSGAVQAQDNRHEGFTCLEKKINGEIIIPASNRTSPHLTVSSFQYVGDLTVKFTGILIYYNLEPYTEGCEDTDSSILIYRTEDDTPLFYRTGNINGKVLPHDSLLTSTHPPYKMLGRLTKSNDLIVIIGYFGNCGGCFSGLVFDREPIFSLAAEYYFDPAKYGELEGPMLKRYDSSGKILESYRVE
jgi:hypothetical protein